MNNEAKNFLRKCLEIYSPSGQEKKYSEFLANYLKKHGFNVSFDNVGNIIAKKGSGNPMLLLVSHLDTVPGELPVIEKDGKLFGRGAVDCKPSLAAMVYSISNYNFDQIDSGTIIFAGIVREEDSLIGIENFIKSLSGTDFPFSRTRLLKKGPYAGTERLFFCSEAESAYPILYPATGPYFSVSAEVRRSCIL